MALPLDSEARSTGSELLRNHWKPEAVAKRVGCSTRTAQRWEWNLQVFGCINPPYLLKAGRPRKVPTAAKKALIQHSRAFPWKYQDELAEFLDEEWGIEVSRQSISRYLKEAGVTNKQGQRIGPQSQVLRDAWQTEMLEFTAEQLVFVDESLFKMMSCWRSMAYGPIGDPARYHDDMDRGDTWSILPAYTKNGYLPCTGIRKGYYNTEAFVEWLNNELLPYCNPFPGPRSIICLDNASIHTNPVIEEAIQAAGLKVRYLPPYSPDFNPIELTFSVLKAWMRRNYRELRAQFEGEFGLFLAHAIEVSGCDRFAKEHFRHSAGGYLFEGDYEACQRELEHWANQID